MQSGFDIKIAYCLAANNRNVRCAVEYKSHEKESRFAEILEKLHDAQTNQPDIDHWILIAPRARLTDNVPDRIARDWNEKHIWPFTVQFWMADTGVGSLFGLEPAVYDRWIDHPPDEEHPKDWSPEKQEAIRQRWLAKLKPPLRLPPAWAKYVTDPGVSSTWGRREMSTPFYPRKARKNTEREEKFFNHRGHSAAEPQPKCLNVEEVNHKDTKARRETLDL
uniref:Restriction endonuclease n=2 Tax=Candidatus Kentrum sp. FM TaxID=2126340 RepID=A0A450S0B7_9GAMM